MQLNQLIAQQNFGANAPPLSPVKTRAPGFTQIFAEVAEKVIPTVVSIRSEKIENVREFNPFEYFFGQPGGRQQQPQPERRQRRTAGIGSGVIISSDGYILTNNHVVEGADELVITLSDKREFRAKIIGTDPPSDVAIIKIEDVQNLPVAHLGNSDNLRIGEMVLAIGSPFSLSETVTMGIVSARGRETNMGITQYENFIQTDAAINPGNSGGALVDMNGSVIGINTAIYSRSGGSQGVGFAIPINMAREIINILVSEGRVSRGWLGVSIQNIDGDLARALDVEPNSGVLVQQILENTPAEKAGILPGDIIIEVKNKVVRNTVELRNKVAMIKPGTSARFKVLRDGKVTSFNITLAERDEDPTLTSVSGGSEATKEKTGLSLRNLSPRARREFQIEEDQPGVLIIAVDPASPAGRRRTRGRSSSTPTPAPGRKAGRNRRHGVSMRFRSLPARQDLSAHSIG